MAKAKNTKTTKNTKTKTTKTTKTNEGRRPAAKRSSSQLAEAGALIEAVEDALDSKTWQTLDEIADGVNGEREGAVHVALQHVEQALAVLIEGGRAEKGAAGYRAKVQVHRRTEVLRALALEERLVKAIATESGQYEEEEVDAELRQLRRHGVVTFDERAQSWILTDETMDAIARFGASALAKASVPEAEHPSRDAVAAVLGRLCQADEAVEDELRLAAGLSEEAFALALRALGQRVQVEAGEDDRAYMLTPAAKVEIEDLGVLALARQITGTEVAVGDAAPAHARCRGSSGRRPLGRGRVVNFCTMTHEEALAELVRLDVARWGEAEREASIRMHRGKSRGLLINAIVHHQGNRYGDAFDAESKRDAERQLTAADRAVLRR